MDAGRLRQLRESLPPALNVGHPDGRRRLLRAGLDVVRRRLPPDHALRQHARGRRARRGRSRDRRGRRANTTCRATSVVELARVNDTTPARMRVDAVRARLDALLDGARVTGVDGGELLARATGAARRHAPVRAGWRAHQSHLVGGSGHGIRIIDVRHEAAAAHCAEGWALATGEPGVALVTAGPGLTNALTGIATAHAQRSPIVVIAGAATYAGPTAARSRRSISSRSCGRSRSGRGGCTISTASPNTSSTRGAPRPRERPARCTSRSRST